MAQPSDVYRNQLLENISIAAFQDEAMFVARQAFPTVPSQDEAGKYYEFDMSTIARNDMKPRAPGAPAEEGTWKVSQVPFLCESFGYKEKVPEELQASAGPAANADTAATLSVAEKARISEELRWGAAFWATSKWARDVAGANSAGANDVVYWNKTAADPVKDVQAEGLKMLLRGKRKPNLMILGADVAMTLLNHPTIIGRLNNGQTPGGLAQASLDDLAKAFKVDKVLVAEAVYNSAAENATPVDAYCLNSKAALLLHVAKAPTIFTPSAGYNFTWKGLTGNNEGIRTWRYHDMDTHSTKVEIGVNNVFHKVAAKLGTFFSAVIE